MRSLFLEFKDLFEKKPPSVIKAFKNGKEDLCITVNGTNPFELEGSEQYRFRDLLWRAGIIEPANEKEIRETIAAVVSGSFKDNRQLALALDTSILLLNHINRYVKHVEREYRRRFSLTRLPILLVAQATQYELHHMASSERSKPKHFPDEFVLPSKTYNLRGQRGKFGAFMLQTLMDRYPLIMAKPGFPMLMLKPEKDQEKPARYSNISPTSPVFDFLIVEQFTQLSKMTNMEILFLTTDANLSKVASQSGLKSSYLDHGHTIRKFEGLGNRQMIWILIHLLWSYDFIYVDDTGYCMARNSTGCGANLYFKKSNGEKRYLELDVDDRVF